MASAALGSDWTATLIQTGPANDGAPLIDRLINLARRTKQSVVAALARKHSPDVYLQSLVGLEPHSTDAAPGLFKTSDPNSPTALAFLRNAAPDLVLVYGASILRSDWLTLPRLGCLNMHYGVLPFYRSSHSTQFALLHERPDLVGATIHYLDAGVDTGAIVRRYYVDPAAHSTVNQVVGAVYAAGARGLLEIARESIAGGSRLASQVEKAANSYYPGKLGTPAVTAGARWRHSELSKRWPYTEQCIEKSSLGRPSPFTRGKLVNGVYILLYHSVPDPSNLQPWEKSYGKVATSRANFAQHIDWLISEGLVHCR
ncbi:MAG: formyl transferase [Pseudolabrys sp.]|nr:formyl transferase [Pseudolabrys sp.]MDP2295515.1 formyl transferase [Pseudolabrys sp.]